MNWLGKGWENRAIYRYHFLQSTYISSIWAWFLTFWGKAAEPFLCVSVLYSGAKLLPEVNTNPTVDTVMFIGQMLALDIGGLSLGKIAQQLEREGNEEQARFIKKVSFFLIGLMIANVVLATVQHLFPQLDPRWITGVESVLLIIRSVMAVIYGYIIYNLHPASKQDLSVVKSSEVKSQYEELMNALAALEKKVTEQCVNFNRHTQTELTKRFQDQGEVLTVNMREELTTALHQQTVNMNRQVIALVNEQSANIGTQVTLALNEHTVNLTESLSQQLHEHLVKLTAKALEEVRTWEPVTKRVTKKLTGSETGEVTSEGRNALVSGNRRRSSNITVLTVNASSDVSSIDKKRLVEQCLVEHPCVKNADIRRMVKERGIDVTPAYISMIRSGKRA